MRMRLEGSLWARVEELAARASSAADLELHGLLPFASARTGDGVPGSPFARLDRAAAVAALAATDVLSRVATALDGDVVLVKGLEVARYYPEPRLRPFVDLDVLVPDRVAAESLLVAAGCRYVGDPRDFVGLHHGRPLVFPDAPIPIEVHDEPKWPIGLRRPDPAELFRIATPSRTGVRGILAPPPAAHALLIAAHAWAHEPLRAIRPLLDIAVLLDAVGDDEVATLARRWGVARLWRTTSACVDSLFRSGPRPWAERLWARHLDPPRDRTVAEQHATQWLATLWASPPWRAVPLSAAAFARDFLPRRGESWRAKVARAQRSLEARSSPSSAYARAERTVERASTADRPRPLRVG